MNLNIVHVTDLNGMRFNIPLYQRGYRWETKQVCELLDDLLEFSRSKTGKEGQFYCIQPLVVVKNEDFTKRDTPCQSVYDVVDGQQRLTTLFLLMNYLDLPSYHLRYERACSKNEQNADHYMNGELMYSCLSALSHEQIAGNPDYFYITRAMEDIKAWFAEKIVKFPGIKDLVKRVVVNSDYETPSARFDQAGGEYTDINAALKDIRFIWYDASDLQSIDYKGSIEVFKRLNYGKTALTSAELIKALLFQCDIYEISQKPEMKQIAFRMSTEWDNMEKQLQDTFIWSMLMPYEINKASHIDIVLSFVAHALQEEYEIQTKVSRSDKDYDYQIISKYIEKKVAEGKNQSEAYKEVIKQLWARIQDVFAIFRSWFEDRELYHLIGLYFTLRFPKKENRMGALKELVVLYRTCDRGCFISKLKKEKIGKYISLNGKKTSEEEPLSLDNINYNDNWNEIIRILLVYNVDMSMKHRQDRQYFPFHFYQNTTPSLEHIHPQHLHDEDIDFPTRCQWYQDKRSDLKKVDKYPGEKDIREAIDCLDVVLLIEDNDNKADKEKKYKANEAKYLQCLGVIDKLYDELVTISEEELHSIRNMALVDKDTNARLGNGLMTSKRDKLIEQSKRYDATNGKEGACTFIGTWKVFNKEYCTDSDNVEMLKQAANMRFWTKLDRDNYLKDIKETYNEYAQ